MTSKKLGILAGSALAGALLLGTAGLAAAQDPTATPSPTPWSGMNGAGMMGDQNGGGMMGGQNGGGMMGGQNGGGMMGAQMGGAGMMGGVALTPDQLEKMNELHDEMVVSGTCDPAGMQEFHAKLQSSN
jgi:Spy/CpxP family protein refolding chaperone